MGAWLVSMRTAVLAASMMWLAPGQGDVPDPLWRGVARLGVHCLVQSDRGVESGDLDRDLCERVRALAADGAPMPVTRLALGDRALLAHDSVTLLVHATVERGGDRPLLAIAIRPHRNDPVMAGLLFGTSPRAVPLDDGAAVDRAIVAALDLTLPWRRAADRPLPDHLQPEA